VAGFLGAPAMAFIDGELDGAGRYRAGTLALDLATPGAGAVTLGLRPEHVAIRDDAPLRAEVTLVEPMGNHQVVWLRCGGHALSALVHDTRVFQPGQQVGLAIDATRVSLFDPRDGRRL